MVKQRKLTPERRTLITQLLQTYHQDVKGVQDMLKYILGDILQDMLETEQEDETRLF